MQSREVLEKEIMEREKSGKEIQGMAIRMTERRKRNMRNEMKLEFDAISENEGFARIAVAAFMASLDPTLEEVADVKTAVSEAVTNAIIHGYDGEEGKVYITCELVGDVLAVTIEDQGKGIEDVEKAMEPLYTTKPELDRSGMGFAFMEAFMDNLQVESEIGKGTKIQMVKKLGTTPWIHDEES